MNERAERAEFKFAAEGMDATTGKFAGYAAVFGNVDSHGDLIEKGAFRATLGEWKARSSFPSMKLMHGTGPNPFSGSDVPIGKWTEMREDDRGLYVEGKLSGMNTDRGKFHYALMEDGALNGLSIGFKTRKALRSPTSEVKRRLQDLKLMEVSLVPEGSNDQALITELKSWTDGELPSLSQFEKFLREVGQFSNTEAKAIAGNGLSYLLQREAGSSSDEVDFWSALGAQVRA